MKSALSIRQENINWELRTVQIVVKGRKEAYAPFGGLTENYLKTWLKQHQSNDNLWGLNQWGIASMLRRLETVTGLPCNPHTFRRTFACLLRKAGVDTMTIKDLGRYTEMCNEVGIKVNYVCNTFTVTPDFINNKRYEIIGFFRLLKDIGINGVIIASPVLIPYVQQADLKVIMSSLVQSKEKK